jgi:hypothetical protein
LGPRWFDAEYNCAFLPLAGAYFDPADIEAAFASQREGIELDLLDPDQPDPESREEATA